LFSAKIKITFLAENKKKKGKGDEEKGKIWSEGRRFLFTLSRID